MRILVCDDYCDGFRDAKDAIGKWYSVEGLVGDDLQKEVATLFRWVGSCLSSEPDRQAQGSRTGCGKFKGVDLVIIDNNLAGLEAFGARLTAEGLIGYLRGFTNVPYIVSLNKNPDVDFDLRYLIGDYQSQADLALNTEHLQNKILWEERAAQDRGDAFEFAPWYWPNLVSATQRRRRQIELVAKYIEDPLLKLFDFPDVAMEALSRRAKGVLSPEATDDASLRAISPLDFFLGSCHALPKAERENIHDKVKALDQDAKKVAARLVAADLERWIRRDVVGPQELVVDWAHLMARMPFLFGERASNVDGWNQTLCSRAAEAKFEKSLVAAEFSAAELWLGSRCFWWPILRADKELNEVFFSAGGEWADVVFCEDISRFVEFSTDESGNEKRGIEGVMEFETEFEGSWTRRYVARVSNLMYSPRSRFAL